MKVKTLAIPLRTNDYSESSQVVVLFTRDLGLVEGIAKGAHREKSSFQGPFDLGVVYEVVLIERRGSGLSLLTESSVVEGLRGLRRSWPRFAAASHVLDVLRTVATASAQDVPLFDLARACLGVLDAAEGDRIPACLARFDALALRALGLLGPIAACVRCGRPWPGGDRPAFLSPAAGGLLCSRCRGASSGGAVPLTGSAVRLLGLLTDFDARLDAVEACWPEGGASAAEALSALRDHMLERELRGRRLPRVR